MPRYSLLVIRGGVIMGMFIIRRQKEFTWMDAAGKIYKGSVGNTSQLVKPLGDFSLKATKKPTSNSGWYSSTTGGYSGPLYK